MVVPATANSPAGSGCRRRRRPARPAAGAETNCWPAHSDIGEQGMKNKLQIQLAEIEKELQNVRRLSSKQKRALARKLVQIIIENETNFPYPDIFLVLQSGDKVFDLNLLTSKVLHHEDDELVREFKNFLLKDVVRNARVSPQLRICFAKELRDQETLFSMACQHSDKSRLSAIQALGELGAKQQLLQLRLKADADHDNVMEFEILAALARLGEIDYQEVEHLDEKISLWDAIRSDEFLNFVRLVKKQYPDIAARMLYQYGLRHRPFSKAIISELKDLGAREFLVAIVKSEQTSFGPDQSGNSLTDSFRQLERIQAEISNMDQALDALFDLGDQQSLLEIANDPSVFLHLRKKAEDYLKKLKGG